jgi:hypothetical protein
MKAINRNDRFALAKVIGAPHDLRERSDDLSSEVASFSRPPTEAT